MYFFFYFKQKTAYEIMPSLVGSEMCIRDRFRFSTDPELVGKVTDVVGLYLAPPTDAIVLCVDEKSQIQALDRRGAVQCLDLGLLIHAQHDRVGGWGQVQAHDVGDLADQLGIGGEPERARPPRLDPRLAPDRRDGRVTDPQVLAQQPGGPVRDPVPLRRPAQRGRDDLGPIHLSRPPKRYGVTHWSTRLL